MSNLLHAKEFDDKGRIHALQEADLSRHVAHELRLFLVAEVRTSVKRTYYAGKRDLVYRQKRPLVSLAHLTPS